MMEDQLFPRQAAGSLAPTSPDERIPALDIIRGFALLGVLLAYTLWNLGNPSEHTYSRMDRLLDTVLTALIDTKFYTTFAFLFGVGFALQLTRARARGAAIVLTYCRRVLALLAIGLAMPCCSATATSSYRTRSWGSSSCCSATPRPRHSRSARQWVCSSRT